jgi:hypothetical protein
MGIPGSEVGYTSATTGRGDHGVHKGHAVVLGGKKIYISIIGCTVYFQFITINSLYMFRAGLLLIIRRYYKYSN